MEENIKILEEKINNIKKYNTYRYDWTETDVQTVENLINRNKELEEENKFLRNQELGYIAGYEDGKKHKMTAVAMRIENMKYELYERHIKALKKRIEDLLSIEKAHRKENGELRERVKELEEENETLKVKADFKLYISGMRNGKELLKNTLTDYNDLSIKVLKLQSIIRYTIDDLIDLFLEGYTLKKD